MSTRSIVHLMAACLLALVAGCGSDLPGEGPAVADRAPHFVERSAAAGLDFKHVSGSPEQRYILESMSSGAAFFDADGDANVAGRPEGGRVPVGHPLPHVAAHVEQPPGIGTP